MARTAPPEAVKLIAGLLAGRAEWLDMAQRRLVDLFGPTDLVSPDLPFTFTQYYQAQMGEGLLRRLVSFGRLIDPGELRAAKLATNALEAELAAILPQVPRPVNIDPGYVSLSKLVLASAKDFSHRVYLGEGIYAELTLQFRAGAWQKLPWTFPDYASGLYDAFLSEVRTALK